MSKAYKMDYVERTVLKCFILPKWAEKNADKKSRTIEIHRERSKKYYGPPDLSSVTVPPLFIRFWPPSIDDLIISQNAMPPIFEGNLKDEYLWWLKKV